MVLDVGEALGRVVAVVVEGREPGGAPEDIDGLLEAVERVGVDGVVGLARAGIDLAIEHRVAEVVLAAVLNLHRRAVGEHPRDVGLGEDVGDAAEDGEDLARVRVVEVGHLLEREADLVLALALDDLLDVAVEFGEVEDGVDDAGRGPRHDQTVGEAALSHEDSAPE